MNPGGAIFDLDGTLIASETTYLRAWRLAAEECGERMDDRLYVRLMGFNRADTICRLGAIWESPARAEVFVDASQRHYDRLVAEEGHVLRAGIRELLDYLVSRRTPLAVATSSHRRLAEDTLAGTGLSGYFGALAAGDEVQEGKPAPEIYLLAAARLGVRPTDCVAVEDSATGATAALAAGMTVVLVPEMESDELPEICATHRCRDHHAALEWLQRG